jgi:4-amino-4-deoxy-L-arabinose transferase-like glycosyltransferase
LAGALGVVVLIVLVAWPSFAEPPGRDQGFYLYAGREFLAGKMPHRDLFDQRPPGTLSVYALGMALFGESMGAVRTIDLIWRLLAAGVVYLIGRRIFGRTAGLWGALLFGVSYELFFNWWDSVACDGLMILPLALAVYFAVLAEDHRKSIFYVWAGVFCAAAFWFKPSAAWIALGLGLVAVVARPGRDAVRHGAGLCAGFLLMNGVLAGVFWLNGGLLDMISQVYLFNWYEHIHPRFDHQFLREWAY